MRVPLTYIIILWVGLGVSYTQPNLILNPSVEDTDLCYDIGQGNFDHIQHWSVPNKSTPDYFSVCHLNPQTAIPKNDFGFQFPLTGGAYVGMGYTNTIPEYREAIQGTFSEPLQKGRKYCFEVHIVKANMYRYAVENIGIHFSKDIVNTTAYNCYAYPPNATVSINYLDDTITWTKVHVEINNYEDGIKNFIISNFQEGGNLSLKLVDGNSTNQTQAAYYYFDDFVLYDCGEADTLPDTVDTASINFPSVFTPNGDGINDVLHMEGLPPGSNLEVYNRWGEIVYKAYPYTEPWDGNKNGQPCPEGVYHYIVQLPDGQTIRKFLHVFR